MALPSGLIVAFFGAIVDIPNGYRLCDGNNGTPDLRNKFIVGAGDTYNPDDEGGATTHPHTFTGDGHGHILNAGTGLGAGANWSASTNAGLSNGETDAASSLPPYYALAFIMKL